MSGDSIPKNIFYVIPDTSWLLKAETRDTEIYHTIDRAQRFPAALRYASLPLRIPFKMIRGILNEQFYSDIGQLRLSPTFILLAEVTNEIVGLHTGNRAVSTGKAKDAIRQIMDSQRFERMSAQDVGKVTLEEGSLGIDSQVDHGIVSTAVLLSKATDVTRVVVLTHDSGIKLELASQRRKNGFRVFSSLQELREDHQFNSNVAWYLLKHHGIGRIV